MTRFFQKSGVVIALLLFTLSPHAQNPAPDRREVRNEKKRQKIQGKQEKRTNSNQDDEEIKAREAEKKQRRIRARNNKPRKS